MTPKNCAINLIKKYVERGDPIEWLKAGQMGYASSDYWAQIGGHLTPGDKKSIYSSDWILVTKINGVDVRYAFKLQRIYDEIKHGQLTLV